MSDEGEATTLDDILGRLQRAVQRRFGAAARIENPELATLGGSNRTLLFDLLEHSGRRRLVMRQENYRLAHTPFIAPHDQYRLLELAVAHEIPVPTPIFELDDADGLARGHIVSCVAGETLPRRLLNDQKYALARAHFAAEAGGIIGRLHSIDVAYADFLATTPDSRDPLAAQLARLDAYGEAHPAVELAVRWLERHRPPSRTRRLLHGDFRTGNLIMDENGIRAVLDWECAHLGDPMEEFGWLCLRSWRFGQIERPVGGFTTRPELYAAYQAVSGIEVDPEAVRWWEIFGFVRWIVLNIMQAHGHWTHARRSPAFASCGRNTCLIEYDLMMSLCGAYQ